MNSHPAFPVLFIIGLAMTGLSLAGVGNGVFFGVAFALTLVGLVGTAATTR